MQQIRNREKVGIWKDRGFLRLKGKCLENPILVGEDLPKKMEEIIDKEKGKWKLKPIENWLSQEEKDAIMDIPLSCNECLDKRVQPHNENGVHSVKSRYMERKRIIQGSDQEKPSSSYIIETKVWKEVK